MLLPEVNELSQRIPFLHFSFIILLNIKFSLSGFPFPVVGLSFSVFGENSSTNKYFTVWNVCPLQINSFSFGNIIFSPLEKCLHNGFWLSCG